MRETDPKVVKGDSPRKKHKRKKEIHQERKMSRRRIGDPPKTKMMKICLYVYTV